MDIDITNALVCDVIGWSDQKGYIEYEIQCSYALNNVTWTVKRRYKEFFNLNLQLGPFGLDLSLPPKKAFGNKKQSFIEERKTGLQHFLDKLTVHPLIYCSASVIAFLGPPKLPSLNELTQYSTLAIRNTQTVAISRPTPNASWRYCKLYSQVIADNETQIFSWMSYGMDNLGKPSQITEILKFIQAQQCRYICKHSRVLADQYGIGVIRQLWPSGSLRDQLYRKPIVGSFWEKYGMENECFVLNINNVKYISRQVLEALILLNSLSVPFVDIHCGNLVVNGTESLLSDIEFALTGQSSFNRPAMIRARCVKTIEDMMVFNFGQMIYEMAAGTLVFPDHCAEEAIMKMSCHYHELLSAIFCPETKLPSLAELCGHPFFHNVNIIPVNRRNFTIPGALKFYLDTLSSNVVKRFQKEKEMYIEKQRNDHIHQFLHSEPERQRRKELVLAELKLRAEK